MREPGAVALARRNEDTRNRQGNKQRRPGRRLQGAYGAEGHHRTVFAAARSFIRATRHVRRHRHARVSVHRAVLMRGRMNFRRHSHGRPRQRRQDKPGDSKDREHAAYESRSFHALELAHGIGAGKMTSLTRVTLLCGVGP